MGREQHRASLPLELAHPIPQVARGLRVETDRRLVEDHERRVGQQRASERQALAHAGGIPLDVVVRTIGELDRDERGIDASS